MAGPAALPGPELPGSPAAELYLYYRVAPGQLADTVAAVRAMQQRLRLALPGLQAQLLRRPELRDGQATVMERYLGAPPAALLAALAAEVAAAGLPQPRHTEWFVPLDGS